MFDGRAEPWRVKVVEPLRRTTREERARALREAGNNLFHLRAEDVFVDLLTDSGVGAMSAAQWGAMMEGDESYAGARSFFRFESAVRQVTGYGHVAPVHQGRGGEHVLAKALLKPGDIVPSNALFDTTRAHVEHVGAQGLDMLYDRAYDIADEHPFKGDLNVAALKALLESTDPGRVPLIVQTVTCNMTGGQPVSMENMRQVAALAAEFDVRVLVDAARFAENCHFIKCREPRYRDRSVAEIARELFSHASLCTMSAKKDALVNIGGFLAFADRALFDKCLPYVILYEGYPTYGGLAGRDLEAIAVGLREGVDDDFLAARIGQVGRFAERLERAGVPTLRPPGGHAVYVDAAAFLPHLSWDEFPGQALALALYLHAGVRAVEVGSLMAGRDPATHKNRRARMELLRLAVPRRMYTDNHLECAAQALIELHERRNEIGAVAFEAESPILRHFTSTFEWKGRKRAVAGAPAEP